MPATTKPVKIMIGQNIRPRTKVQARSSTLRIRNASSVTPARTSSGLRMRPLLTNRIDSWLDMFLVNGHQGIVTLSPTIVRNTRTYRPTVGRKKAEVQASTSTSRAIGNGWPARPDATAAMNSVRTMIEAKTTRLRDRSWRICTSTSTVRARPADRLATGEAIVR